MLDTVMYLICFLKFLLKIQNYQHVHNLLIFKFMSYETSIL